jgi:hypothetical protein
MEILLEDCNENIGGNIVLKPAIRRRVYVKTSTKMELAFGVEVSTSKNVRCCQKYSDPIS